MRRAEWFANSIQDHFLDTYDFLPKEINKLEDTLAYRLFHGLLFLRKGKQSTEYLRSSYRGWITEANCAGRWESLSPVCKRQQIGGAVAYCHYLKRRRDFQTIARLLPNPDHHLIVEVDRIVDTFVKQRKINKKIAAEMMAKQKKIKQNSESMRIAFCLFGDVRRKYSEINSDLMEWLNLVLDTIEVAVFSPSEINRYEDSTPNLHHYKIDAPDQLILESFAEMDKTTLLDMSVIGNAAELADCLSKYSDERYDAVLISPASDQLDPTECQTKLSLLWYEWYKRRMREPIAVTSIPDLS